MKKWFKHALLVSVIGLAMGSNLSYAQTAGDKIIATVAGEAITQADLNDKIKINQAAAKNVGQKPTVAQLTEYSREELIEERLMLYKAKNAGIEISEAQINQTAQQLAAGNRMTLEQYQAHVTKVGGAKAWQGLMRDIRTELASQQLLEKEVFSQVKEPSKREINNEVERLVALEGGPFSPADVAYAAHIMVNGTNAAALKKINLAKARLDKGEAFDTVARSTSEDAETAKNGGMIPEPLAYKAPNLDPNVAAVLASAPLNQHTAAIKASNGYHLFKVFERKTISPTDEEKQQLAKESLVGQRQKEAMGQWYKQMDTLRASLVEIKS